MTSNIVLPSLTYWAQQHLTRVFQTTAAADLDAAFDAFLAKDCVITVNGQKTTRDQYKQQLQGEKFAEASASVKYLGAVEKPASDGLGSVLSGTVGLFFQATIDERFLVLGSPESSTVTSSLNLTIAKDDTIKQPTLPGRGGAFDPRRVTEINQVVVDNQNAVLLPLPNPTPATGSAST